jgi:hypothetical protein
MDLVSQTSYTRIGQPDSVRGPVGMSESYGYSLLSQAGAGSKVSASLYFSDPLGRAKSVIPPGYSSAQGLQSRYGYGGLLGVSNVPLRYATSVDENGVIGTSYFDGLGHLMKTVADSGGVGSKNAETSFVYDALDQLTESHTPLASAGTATGDVTKYWYDTLGRQVKKYQPDADTTRYKYDRLNRLRFSQDAVQAAGGKVTFLSYDLFGRITRIGEVAATFSSLDPDVTQSFESDDAYWKTGVDPV